MFVDSFGNVHMPEDASIALAQVQTPTLTHTHSHLLISLSALKTSKWPLVTMTPFFPFECHV